MSKLPDDIKDQALRYAYAVFDRRRWEQVPASQRGAVFDELVADAKFSEPLRPYLTAAQMRVWIKDSAAKEYPRALEGVGSASQYTTRRFPGPEAIVGATLGEDWAVIAESVEQKPMRCRAGGPTGDEALLAWGPYRILRDLYWAASGARLAGENRVGIVITRPTMACLSNDDWEHVQGLCGLIGAEPFSVMYAPRSLPATDP
ncbi:hypothetical protein V1Y59_18385 [Gordonia sp. PKS22-38]|uniref:Uncharacterized protein n=1 Tax=Gordonia prachuapensis TaxID=3115651 RepID=A0ABU7MZ76_9ACTN|nr:hypothetical protein [Gordonia sp. PKS22-38]